MTAVRLERVNIRMRAAVSDVFVPELRRQGPGKGELESSRGARGKLMKCPSSGDSRSGTERDALSAEVESEGQGAAGRFVAWLFKPLDGDITPERVVQWWEARRLVFNVIVGVYGAGCFTVYCLALAYSGQLSHGEDPEEPLVLLVAPIIINLLYTLGWVVERLARSLEPDVSPRFGVRLFKLGLGFGLFCLTEPAVWEVAVCLVRVAGVHT